MLLREMFGRRRDRLQMMGSSGGDRGRKSRRFLTNCKLQTTNCKLQKAKMQIFLPTIHLAFTIPLTWGRSKMQMQAKRGWVIRFQAKFTEDEIFAQPQRLLCKMTHGQDCVAWALLSKMALSNFAIQTWCHHNMQTIMHYLHLFLSPGIDK